MRRAGWLLIAVLIGLAAVGCSRIGLVYNRLDTLLYLRLGAYVDLDKQQKAELVPRFDAFWAWHRRTQLPLYADELRKAQQQLGVEITAAQVKALGERVRHHARITSVEFARVAAPTLASLTNAQVESMLAAINKRMAKETRKRARLSDAEAAEERADQAIDRLDEWAGSVTPAQRRRIEQWSRVSPRPPPDPYAKRREAFAALLQQRGASDFAARVERYGLQPFSAEALKERQPQRDLNDQLMADLHHLATPEQRAYLKQKIEALKMEMDTLTRPAKS